MAGFEWSDEYFWICPLKKRQGGAIKWIITALVVLVFVVFLAPATLLMLAITFGSERTVFERAISPGGWREARVQFDDAGAISGFSRLVFVKPRWDVSDAPLLSCRAFWADGEAKVHLRWLDDRTLLIEHAFEPASIQAVADHCGPVRLIVRPAVSAKGPS
jgi:hypothetical protein